VIKGAYLVRDMGPLAGEPLGMRIELAPLPSSGDGGGDKRMLKRVSSAFLGGGGGFNEKELLVRAPNAKGKTAWMNAYSQYTAANPKSGVGDVTADDGALAGGAADAGTEADGTDASLSDRSGSFASSPSLKGRQLTLDQEAARAAAREKRRAASLSKKEAEKTA
jgi:hypothetical protein